MSEVNAGMPRAQLFKHANKTFPKKQPLHISLSYQGVSAEGICKTLALKEAGRFDYSALLVEVTDGKVGWVKAVEGKLEALLEKAEAGTITHDDVKAYLQAGLQNFPEEKAEAAAEAALMRPRGTEPEVPEPEAEPEPAPPKKARRPRRAAKKKEDSTLTVPTLKTPIPELVKDVAPAPALDIDSLVDTLNAAFRRDLERTEESISKALDSHRADVDDIRHDLRDTRATLNDLGRMVAALNENLLAYAAVIVPGVEDTLIQIEFVAPDEEPPPAEVGEVPIEEDEEEPLPPEPEAEAESAEPEPTPTKAGPPYDTAWLEALDENELRALARTEGLENWNDGYPAALVYKLSRLSA